MVPHTHTWWFRRARILNEAYLTCQAEGADGAVFAAAFADGRLLAIYSSDTNAVARSLQKPLDEFGADDATLIACWAAATGLGTGMMRGCTIPCTAAFGAAGTMGWLGAFMKAHPIVSRRLCASDDLPTKLTLLLMEQLRGGQLPAPFVAGGAMDALWGASSGRPAVLKMLAQSDIFDMVLAGLRSVGSPAEWLSIKHGGGALAGGAFALLKDLLKAFENEEARPEAALFYSSGLYDECIDALCAMEARGEPGVADTNCMVLGQLLNSLTRRDTTITAGEERMRGAATALKFIIDHPLECISQLGATCDGMAVGICTAVFGRDEEGSPFLFSQEQVDTQVLLWTNSIQAVGWFASEFPNY